MIGNTQGKKDFLEVICQDRQDSTPPELCIILLSVYFRGAYTRSRAFNKGNALSIPSFLNKLSHLDMHFFPRKWVVWFESKVYRPHDYPIRSDKNKED